MSVGGSPLPPPSSLLPYIGRAGWSLSRTEQAHVPAEGASILERYAKRFPAVEINSSFYRPHRPTTYARWGACVPPEFRFAVKIPKQITHELRLAGAESVLHAFLGEATYLGERLGPLLVQLPPSFAYEEPVARAFFEALRARHEGAVVFEPRHPTWFTDDVERLLVELRIARVAADPARVPAAAEPAGWPGIVYYRLHGSPRVYYDLYDDAYMEALAVRLRAHMQHSNAPVWCIFDNTALGAATTNAVDLMKRLRSG
ncbi:MAG: DUF72 domain-containing protein [Gemmatimonadota bacterium]|nr:DUF72 domain-containing protein [Gemmatimonadota bacterium]